MVGTVQRETTLAPVGTSLDDQDLSVKTAGAGAAPNRGARVAPPPAYPGGPIVGRAWLRFVGSGPSAGLDLQGESIRVPAGARGTWTVAYQAEAWPVQPGGRITIWKWAPKFAFGMGLQAENAALPDYCSAHVEPAVTPPGLGARPPARVELTDVTPRYKRYRQATLIVRDAALGSGDTLCFVAGATAGGAPPASVQAFTAEDVAIDVQVDHDGDGHPETQHRLWIHIVAGPATRLRAVAPSLVTERDTLALAILAEDQNCNSGVAFDGTVRVTEHGRELASGHFSPAGGPPGTVRLDGLRLEGQGVHRLEVIATPSAGGAPLRTLTNPIRVVVRAPAGTPAPLRPTWGEMHNHTTWCEGMATVDENYRFARDAACLDWYSASEHIMLGPGDDFPITDEDSPMASSAVYWEQSQEAARRYHEPGRFVTFIGYEWTALLGYDATGKRRSERSRWGDHCAWFLRDDHPLVIAASIEEELASLADLANAALARGERPPAMIIPHPGGGATDWTHYAGRDLVAMPAVETTSQHAHTEWFYQRAIATGRRDGFKLGVVGMDDGHMGHPGYDVWSRHGVSTVRERAYSVQGGLTAALVPELTREAVWDALFDRRTYATSGERMLLDVWIENATSASPVDPRHARAHVAVGDVPTAARPGRLSAGQMGGSDESPRFRIAASGTATLELVEIIRDDRRVYQYVVPRDTWDVDLTWTDSSPLATEAAYYVRVTQSGSAFAWSSPIWLTCAAPEAVSREAGTASLPLWSEGVWPPEADPASRQEAASHLPALESFLSQQGAEGLYEGLQPVGMFVEHRGRYALYRGTSHGGPIQIFYYPGLAEERIRVGHGWLDIGLGKKGTPVLTGTAETR